MVLDTYPMGVYNDLRKIPLGGMGKRLNMTKNASEQDRSATCAGGQACACHHKETPRSAEFQDDLKRRLNRAIGQLNGVKDMLDDNRYCGDVLTQLAAAESAVHNVSALLLQDHLETCVVEQVQRGNTEVIDEAMKLIKRFAR